MFKCFVYLNLLYLFDVVLIDLIFYVLYAFVSNVEWVMLLAICWFALLLGIGCIVLPACVLSFVVALVWVLVVFVFWYVDVCYAC